ncbi:MAG TPA: CHASE domain-containing protein [Lacunisphaera sp.]|nr:CHASE domain-containing protein [Lacunisphaera sp.]
MTESARPAIPHRGLTWLLLVTGTAVSLVIWHYATRSQAERLHAGFLSRAQTQASVAEQQLRNYREMVFSLRDTFIGQQEVERGEFAAITSTILQRHSGVQALQWVQVVPQAQRAAYEQRCARELGRPFVIRRLQADGTTQPAPESAEYLPITYLEPLAGNEAVLGYDVTSAPTAATIADARASRDFRVTQVFRLLQSRSDQPEPGVVFILPFARPGRPDSPVEGFIQGVFLVRTMLAQSHRLTTSDALDSYYFDVTDSETPTLLYANLAGSEPMRQEGARIKPPVLDDPGDFHEVLELGGRRWLMVIRQNAAWTRQFSSREPLLILLAGLTITALLALVVHSLLQRTTRIEQEVQERTRQLRASEARLQDILDHSPAIIFLKELDGRYLLCNRAFAEFCGRPKDAIVGRRDEDLFPPAAAALARRNDAQVLAAGHPVEFEETLCDPADRRVYIAHKFPLRDEHGKIYALCGISTEITERKTAEDQRLDLERKLLQSQKLESLGVLAGGVAHDFNNILTAILGNATLAGLDLPPTHKARPQLEQIERAARRAADLCAQMLAYAGRASFVNAPVSLSRLVRDTTALLEVSVGRRVRLELLVDDSVPAVMGDATQLRQIVMNLVINAADAMGNRSDGQVTVRTFAEQVSAEFLLRAVGSPTRPSGTYVGLEVVDNGSGMDATVLGRIFEPFFTTKFSGRGLGLAAVLGIVQTHQGALFVESAPGKGTTFRLFLPATQGQAAETAVPFAHQAAEIKGKVLVVDDEEPVRQVAEGALAVLGVSVVLAPDGQSALEVLRHQGDTIDLVLLDLTMPGMSGDETLRRLRELRPEIRAIIMSGYSETETRQRCASLGVSDFLPKPFDVVTLTAKLRPHLG